MGHYCSAAITSNIISGNAGSAVLVPSGFEQVEGANIRANSIYANGRLGINLQPGYSPSLPIAEPDNTVTAEGRGAPNIPDVPIITAVAGSNTVYLITGTVSAQPNLQCSLDFFRSATADPSGYGEGEVFLGAATVLTDSAGKANFTFTTEENLAGQFVTATSTTYLRGFTSEFSKKPSQFQVPF